MIPCTKILRNELSVHQERSTGPLFVWNVTSRCNLFCSHCYRDSALTSQGQDLSDTKCFELIPQIKGLNPPIVLLSGGEPLLRKNIFDIVRECKACGLRVGLSTNGTLINRDMAFAISRSKVDYVGISIDGKKGTHDAFRGSNGAFEASWEAIRLLNELRVKTGVRFTLTGGNYPDLMDILERTVQSGSKRFCLYHLVYAGRAGRSQDLAIKDKRTCLEGFFKKVGELVLKNPDFEVLTTDNPADALFLSELSGINETGFSCLSAQGGCSAGERVVYLDSSGEVYPCQFLRERSLGSVLESSLSALWENTENPFLSQLRNKKDLVTGKCGSCRHKNICAGCRARALAYHGSLWAEDPACYLEDHERNAIAVSCSA